MPKIRFNLCDRPKASLLFGRNLRDLTPTLGLQEWVEDEWVEDGRNGKGRNDDPLPTRLG